MVAMSDGVKLAVDVYRPINSNGRPASGRFPVILSQTPYGKRSATTTQSMGSGFGGDGFYPYLVQRGYIDVVADVRGTGSSDGDFQLFGPREKQDGVDLVRWAARLPGSSGRVGLAGSSYVGLNQLFTAALAGRRSPVKAIVPGTVGNDLYRDLAYGGGIPNLEFDAVWEGLRASMTAALPDEPMQDPKSAVDHIAARGMTLAQFDAQLYAEGDTGGPRAFDTDFWTSRAPRNYLDRVVRNGIPALIVSGWRDVYQRGAVLDLAGLQNAWSRAHGGPGRPAAQAPPMTAKQRPTGRYQLVVGPWFHDPTTLGLRFQQMQLAWFDRWLKGIHDGIDRTSTPLHVFELGTDRWIDISRWPLLETRARTFYLAPGNLAPSRPRAAGADQLPWTNARSPCNTGTDQWTTGLPAYAIAQMGGRGDPCSDDDRTTQAAALTYTSAPFQRATTIAGPIDATLYLSSNRPDAELVATVEVVAPDGSSRPLGTGALLGSLRTLNQRLSWRQNGRLILPWHPYTSASARTLTPGAVERLDVEVFPAVARIAPGEHLRLTVTSGDTALQPSAVQVARLAGGVYSIQRGGRHDSALTLPMAVASALRSSRIDWGGCNGSC
jgi:putative CocE/NonD family hydrolase